MAEYLDGCDDARLKTRLLLSLLRDALPDAPVDSSRLPRLLRLLRHHSLLSESPPDDAWRSAVDAWVLRILALASSSALDRRLLGTGLLGVTCAECTDDRFLNSYFDWFQKLLSNFQPLPDSHFLRVTLCASLSDLFTRLGGYPSVKKDATSLSVKVVQLLLQLLNKDSSNDVWIQAIDLLCVLVNFYPSSVHRHIDNVEAVIVSKIMSAKYSEDMSKKLAGFLALLPRAKGDEASLSLMFKKILMAINIQLDNVFQGLEDVNISLDIKKLLNPPGDEIVPLLGGHVVTEKVSKHTVAVPIHILLKVVRRILSVDGSLKESLLPSITSLHQESVCSVLMELHSGCLDLLSAIIKGLKSQLLPHAVYIVKILTDYFHKALVFPTRTKLYQVLQQLLISSGAGMSLYLSQEVIKNAFIDLGSSDYGISVPFENNSTAKPAPSRMKKRKHVDEVSTKDPNGVGIEVKADERKQISPICVQIAALGALDSLLTVGGALMSELWRSDVDLLLMKVAGSACDAVTCDGRNLFLREESTFVGTQFPLAALHALLSSLLSPSHLRPPYLSEGLEIFHKGKLGTDPNIAAFCSHSLLALEVLIHPRALPLSQPSEWIPSYDHSRDEKFSKVARFSVVSAAKQHPDNHVTKINLDEDDDLYNRQGNVPETDTLAGYQDKRFKASKVPDIVSTDCQHDAQTEPMICNPSESHSDHMQTKPADAVRPDIHETIEMSGDQGVQGEMSLGSPNSHTTAQSRDEPCLQETTPSMLVSNAATIPVETTPDASLADTCKISSAADASRKPLVIPDLAHHYDSDDSSSLGSIPAIVDVEPDTDSDQSS